METTDPLPLLVPIPRVQTELGLGKTKVHELIALGRLRSCKVGRRRLVPRDALVEYVNSLC